MKRRKAPGIGLRVLQAEFLGIPKRRRPDFKIFSLTDENDLSLQAGEEAKIGRQGNTTIRVHRQGNSGAKRQTQEQAGCRIGDAQRAYLPANFLERRLGKDDQVAFEPLKHESALRQ